MVLLILNSNSFVGNNFKKVATEQNNLILDFDNIELSTLNAIYSEDFFSNDDFIKKTLNSPPLFRKFLDYNLVDTIIYFQSEPNENNDNDSYKNVKCLWNVLIVCEDYKILNKFIYFSFNYEGFLNMEEALVLSQFYRSKLPVVILRSNNNIYGTKQSCSKLIPSFIINLSKGKKIQLSTDSNYLIPYIHVYDICSAIYLLIEKGKIGQIYNTGKNVNHKYTILDIAKMLIRKIINSENYEDWIDFNYEPYNFMKNTHYNNNTQLINLGWKINVDFDYGINELTTIKLNPEVVFYHIEKCMGSTLEVALYEYFTNIYDEKYIYLPIKNNCSHYNILEKDFFEKNQFSIILSHISYNEKISNFDKHLSITCVRNPIKRLISHYYYFDYNNYNCPMHELSLDEIRKYILNYKKSILMRLSGNIMALETALSNLKEINCILIFENIEKDIKLLENYLNNKFSCDFRLNLKNENITTNEFYTKDNINKDMEFLEKSNLLEDEMLLYKYITNLDEKERFKPM